MHHIVDLASLPGVHCPCGIARRAFGDVANAPISVHLTEITKDAKTHYHTRQTETYYILECGPDAALELDGKRVPIRTGMAIMIPPGVKHRGLGEMKILNIVSPPFDPQDEIIADDAKR